MLDVDECSRHKMDADLEQELQRSVRYKSVFSVLLFDIEWFKQINDTYGHPTGDAVLRELAQLVRANLRVTEIPCRWGGKEFLVLCPETRLEEARALGIRFRSLVEKHQFAVDRRATISVGVTEFTGTEKIVELIKRVDENLYAAKHSGRNTVITGWRRPTRFARIVRHPVQWRRSGRGGFPHMAGRFLRNWVVG